MNEYQEKALLLRAIHLFNRFFSSDPNLIQLKDFTNMSEDDLIKYINELQSYQFIFMSDLNHKTFKNTEVIEANMAIDDFISSINFNEYKIEILTLFNNSSKPRKFNYQLIDELLKNKNDNTVKVINYEIVLTALKDLIKESYLSQLKTAEIIITKMGKEYLELLLKYRK